MTDEPESLENLFRGAYFNLVLAIIREAIYDIKNKKYSSSAINFFESNLFNSIAEAYNVTPEYLKKEILSEIYEDGNQD